MQKFYCMGVPRSGTTYFVHLMNAHPNVFCGMESFRWNEFKSSYLELDNFIPNVKKTTALTYAKKQLSHKSKISATGDKLPRAYMGYKNVIDQMAGGTIFFCLRVRRHIKWNNQAHILIEC